MNNTNDNSMNNLKKKIKMSKPKIFNLKNSFKNPYKNIQSITIKTILTGRGYQDIMNDNSRYNIELLKYLDKKDHHWLKNIYETDITTIDTLNREQLLVYMSINEIDIKNILDLNIYDIRDYIKLLYLYNNDNDKITIFIKNVSDKILYKFYQIYFSDKYIKFITINDIKKIILNKNDNHISYQYFDTILERIVLINNSNSKTFIYLLYNIDDIYNIINLPINPLEEIFLNIENYKLDQLIDEWGIIIPNQYSKDMYIYMSYILTTLLSYTEVIKRGENFKKYSSDKLFKLTHSEIKNYLLKLTDKEIFNLIGVYIFFENRINLIDNIISILTKPRFMYPLKLYNDNSEVILAYGTLLSHQFISLEELYHFWSDGVNQNIEMNNKEVIIDNETIVNLKYLLENIDVNSNDTEYKITILNNIDQFIIINT